MTEGDETGAGDGFAPVTRRPVPFRPAPPSDVPEDLPTCRFLASEGPEGSHGSTLRPSFVRGEQQRWPSALVADGRSGGR